MFSLINDSFLLHKCGSMLPVGIPCITTLTDSRSILLRFFPSALLLSIRQRDQSASSSLYLVRLRHLSTVVAVACWRGKLVTALPVRDESGSSRRRSFSVISPTVQPVHATNADHWNITGDQLPAFFSVRRYNEYIIISSFVIIVLVQSVSQESIKPTLRTGSDWNCLRSIACMRVTIKDEINNEKIFAYTEFPRMYSRRW